MSGPPAFAASPIQAAARGESLADDSVAGGSGGGHVAPSIEAARAYGRFLRPTRIPDPLQPSGFRLARVGDAMPPSTAAAAAAAAATAQQQKANDGGARVADAAGGDLVTAAAEKVKSQPYAFWSTSLQQLDEFGIGVALYFRQLAFLSLLFLFAGLLYLPTMYYNYKHVNRPDTPVLLIGSSLGAERDDLSFLRHGVADVVVCAVLLVFAVASKKVEDAAARAIDTAQQTTQDYAVEILNAPPQIKDPDAYAAYFRRWGDVVFVTVATDNGRLLRLLRRKRELRALLSAKIEGISLLEAERAGASPESLMPPQPSMLKRLLYGLGLYSHQSLVAAEYLRVKAQTAAETARGPSHLNAFRVYAVFNTEAAQRACLAAHRRGLLARVLLWSIGLRPAGALLFHDVALKVQEPVEPSEVRYEAFDVGAWERWLRYTVSTLVAAASLVLSYGLLSAAGGHVLYTAAITSGMNVCLPLFMKTVVAAAEVHIDKSDEQDSVLQKLVVARVFAVVVIKYLVTDYTQTMAESTLASIVSILIADAFTNPVLSLIDLPGRFRKGVLAPFAKSQREMNLYFAGSDWSLAERYTDMIKTAFLSLFWSSILPGGCFLTALAFFVVSFTDKYNLLYQWKRPPLLDSTLARRARNFLVVSVAVHVVMARVFFANWPYADTSQRARCNLLTCGDPTAFTQQQARTVAVFTVLGFVSLVLVVLIYGSFALGSCFRGCCLNKDRRKRRQQVAAAVQDDGSNDTTTTTEIPFRALVGAEPYLPLLHSPLFPEPFFAFDIATVPPRYLPICNHTNQNNHGQEGQHTHKKKTRTFGGASLCSRRDLPSLPTAAARAAFFATVRYYPLPEAEAAAAAGAVEAASLQPASTTVRVPNPSPVAPGSRMMGVLTPAQLQQPEVAVDLAVSKPLPPGWVVMVDTRSGNAYYLHEPTQTTRWDDPTAVQQQASVSAPQGSDDESDDDV